MPLLLTSNGLLGSIKDVFSTLLTKPASDNTVLFITAAAYGEMDNPTWLEGVKNSLREYGITNIIDEDLKQTTQQELEEKLQHADIVFMNGGNTYFLLDRVRKSGFDKAIHQFLAEHKLYIGVSAGTILATPTIEVAAYDLGGEYGSDHNNVGLTDLTALHMVPFLISPHIRKEYMDLIESQSQHASLPQVMLTDTQAILVQKGEAQLVGDGEQITSDKVSIQKLPTRVDNTY